jgi:dihydropteroate synthase-like protein
MPRYLFVTGRLAAQSLKNCLEEVPGLEYDLAILPISVAALMDTRFVLKHLPDPQGCSTVMIPGMCEGDVDPIENKVGARVIRGPKSLKDIPAFFGKKHSLKGYGECQVKILAEIVDAYKMSLEEVLARASYFRSSGADVIDIGCQVGAAFPEIGRIVEALKKDGFLVSVDSFNAKDILEADRAGADFVLSINSQNMELARHLRSKVVVIPDFEKGQESLESNIAQLEAWHVPYIIDPILRPIGIGFAESIGDFIRMRSRHPNSEMLMGIGNVTELTDADTTGINAVMAGIITELGVEYVLTTEVISWARGAVKEFDLARRLMDYACKNNIPPKHLNDGLITIKDPPFGSFSEDELRAMQKKTRDRHFRIFTDREFIYVFNNRVFVKGTDVLVIFDELGVKDASHAFYLGREVQKALLALRLGKKYVQEEDLRWGYLSDGHAETPRRGK